MPVIFGKRARGTVDFCDRMKSIILIEIWERLRSYGQWVETDAKVESSARRVNS